MSSASNQARLALYVAQAQEVQAKIHALDFSKEADRNAWYGLHSTLNALVHLIQTFSGPK